MTLEAVVFDFDGLIIDSEWAIYETARGLGEKAKLTTNKKESDEFKSQGRQLLKGTTALAPKLSGPARRGKANM